MTRSHRPHSITELLNIELPLIQAPMAGVQGSALAIVVCSAGALGSLPCAMLDAGAVRAEVGRIRARGSWPFNLNFFCHVPPQADAARLAAWEAGFATCRAELGVAPGAAAAGPARMPFDAAMAALVEELRPPVVSFHFGLPAPELLRRVRAAGARILSSATTVNEALWLEARGVDAVIAQGVEAGGHRGMFLTEDLDTQLGTFALLPQIVRAVEVPVIAAGGIADADCVRAAFALGAAGVQVGTSYLLCPEASTSALHREALGSERARHTALTNVHSGRPARGIVNRLVREFGPISALAPAFPLASAALAPLRAQAEKLGIDDFSPLWASQNASGCKPVGAAQLTLELARGLPQG